MGYYDMPEPDTALRAIKRVVARRAPSYASLAFTAGARESPHVTRSPGFRNARGETVTPPSTQLRAGPVILTLVWGRALAHPEQSEAVAGTEPDDDDEEV